MCSFSQVMLQKNVLTGFIFFLAVGFSSLIMLVGSTLATISALVVAKLCKYQLTSVQSGLYGFNAVLVGIAVFHFLPFSTVSLLFVVSGGVISSLLMHLMLMRLKSIPALTTPFILTTWLILIIAEHLGVTSALQNNVQPSNIQTTNLPNVVEFFFFRPLAMFAQFGARFGQCSAIRSMFRGGTTGKPTNLVKITYKNIEQNN